MDQVRIGIIGTGFTIGIAKSHFDGYQNVPGAKIVAVYDAIPGRAEAFLKRHGIENVAVAETMEELFDMVDAVSVCTPNYEHVNVAIRAMEAGKHVIVEKPFAVSYEDGLRAMKAHAEHPDLVAMTVFNYREQPEIQMMKKIIDSGKLGRILSVRHIGGGGRMWDGEHVYLEWRMQEKTSGTGSMADFGVHMLDLTDYLLHDQIGDYVRFSGMSTTLVKDRYVIDPQSVMGEKAGDEKAPVTNDDISVFSAITESGALVTFQTGRLVNTLSMFEIAGEQGVVTRSSAYPRGTIAFYDRNDPAGGFPMLKQIPIDEEIMAHAYKGLGHDGVLGEFVDCILTGKTPVRDFRHGVYIQKLIDDFSKAAKTGSMVCEQVKESEIGAE